MSSEKQTTCWMLDTRARTVALGSAVGCGVMVGLCVGTSEGDGEGAGDSVGCRVVGSFTATASNKESSVGAPSSRARWVPKFESGIPSNMKAGRSQADRGETKSAIRTSFIMVKYTSNDRRTENVSSPRAKVKGRLSDITILRDVDNLNGGPTAGLWSSR